MDDRYYLTTAIFYPSPAPPLHSLFEAIGADAIARYHRALGQETRFLTGMDEHSAQVEPMARQHGKEPKDLVDEWAVVWRAAFDRFDISYDRFIRTTDPDHVRASIEMVTPRPGRRRHLQGHLRRLVLPGRQRVQDRCADRRRPLPGSPDPGAAVAGRGELLLRPVALPGAAGAAVRGEPVLLRAGALPQRGAGLAQGGAARLQRQPRRRVVGDPVPGRSGAPDLRLVRRADQLRDRRRLPGRCGHVRALLAGRPARHRQEHHPLPLPLLAGHADERRPAAAAPGLRPRLHAAARREDVQDARQRARSGQRGRPVRRGRRPLPGPARDPVRPRRRHHAARAWSAATTPTWPTTSATCSTARSAWPTATWTVGCRAWSSRCGGGRRPPRRGGARLGRLPRRHGAPAPGRGAGRHDRPGAGRERLRRVAGAVGPGQGGGHRAAGPGAGRHGRGVPHPGPPGGALHAQPPPPGCTSSSASPRRALRLADAAAWGGGTDGLRVGAPVPLFPRVEMPEEAAVEVPS